MHIERLAGLFGISSLIIFILYFFYPNGSPTLTVESNVTQEDILDAKPINKKTSDSKKINTGDFETYEEKDFDFFVYRAHILSIRNNADKLVEDIRIAGLPAFVEKFDNEKDLFAVYVGPFISEDDIVVNMNKIKELSKSTNGEITRWKL